MVAGNRKLRADTYLRSTVYGVVKSGLLSVLRRDQTVAAEIFVGFLVASGSTDTHISGWALVQAWLG